jgi:hypothetical protein
MAHPIGSASIVSGAGSCPCELALGGTAGACRAQCRSHRDGEHADSRRRCALNVSEARQRAGLDRADLFRRAAGSASELTTALRIARARGYITPADFAAVDAVLDRVRAMLWRLTH